MKTIFPVYSWQHFKRLILIGIIFSFYDTKFSFNSCTHHVFAKKLFEILSWLIIKEKLSEFKFWNYYTETVRVQCYKYILLGYNSVWEGEIKLTY